MTSQQYYDLLVKCALDGTFPCTHHIQGDCGFKEVPCFRNGKQRCPIGLLIPDSEYLPDLENRRVYQLPPYLRISIVPEGLTLEDLEIIEYYHDELFSSSWARSWKPDKFIDYLNKMSCFADCKKKEVPQ